MEGEVVASLPARIYGSKHAHRLLPARVALPLAAALGPALRQRRNPAERRAAERFLTDLLLHTSRAGEAAELTDEWLAEKARSRELFWRPWLLRHSRVVGREHWDSAHADGRGCLLVLGHIGPTWAISRILAIADLPAHIVSAAQYWKPLPPGYDGLAQRNWRREYTENEGVRLLRNDGPPERLLTLLERGETVAIAFDVGGSAITPFLGRSVALAGGFATIAARTGCWVLPIVPRRRGSRIDLHLLEPVDASALRDARSVRLRITQTFERVVLEAPHAVELAWYPSPLVTEVPPGELG
jgi:lauroyl/myristoyl acyltransferase